MRFFNRFYFAFILWTISSLLVVPVRAEEIYKHYFGSTHAHSCYSDGKTETPADHFRKAKAAGYDFYAVTDHALKKYKQFTRKSYAETRRTADQFTDEKFVGIVGFEFSENNGPDGRGHLNALNTTGYLDATSPKIGFPQFYDWLVTNQKTTVAASFNHSGLGTYNSYGYLTTARRDGVTMFEMINSGKLHYKAFLAALNKGWRVAPVAALDTHGTWRITRHFYRTGVLAPSLTRENIMQAIRERRLYCTWDRNLRLTVRANGKIMGSVLESPSKLDFTISISDPDTGNEKERITRVEIVGENGALVEVEEFSAHEVTWNITCSPRHQYYFVQVYSADKTDSPTAYSAPIWIETPTAAPQHGVQVEGSRFLLNGKPFVPNGFTLVGLLSPNQTGTAGAAGEHYGQAELDAAKSWKANTLRFQISQRGFDPSDSLYSEAYIRRVKEGVALARKNGFVVILSMQDQAFGGGDATAMPDAQTLRSWDEVTKHFNGDLYIMYELFNEPQVGNSAEEWKLWKDGGDYKGLAVVGHQQLVNCVRASGATNVLIVEGTRWGKCFDGCPELKDPLNQIAYGFHPYLTNPIKDEKGWDRFFGDFGKKHPIIATEWNAVSSSVHCQPDWPTLAPKLLDYLKARKIGLMAWAFDIPNTLVKDWTWAPTSMNGFQCRKKGSGAGELVMKHFSNY